jgi:hypothetical protein
MPAVVAPFLLARPQPHRGSLLQGEEPHIRKAKARTLAALFAVTARALAAISEEDARGFFKDCGYDASRDHPL